MADDIALAALVRKRAELAGRIEAAYAEMGRMLADMASLDATLRIFDPDIVIEAIRPKPFRPKPFRPPPNWAHPEVTTRMVLDMLRRAAGALTTRGIAAEFLAERGLDDHDSKLAIATAERAGDLLRRQRARGVVRSSPAGAGQVLLWELVRD